MNILKEIQLQDFIIYLIIGELTNKYEIASYIKQLINSNKNINVIKTSDLKSEAKRQLNSNLNCDKIDKFIIRNDWKNDVKEYIIILKKQKINIIFFLKKIKLILRKFKCLKI